MRDDDDLRHWWDSARIRENHDYPDYDPDGEVDRWMGRVVIVGAFLAVWKLFELGAAVIRWLAG